MSLVAVLRRRRKIGIREGRGEKIRKGYTKERRWEEGRKEE